MNVRECEKRKIIQSSKLFGSRRQNVKVSRDSKRRKEEENRKEKRKRVRGYHVNTKRNRPTWGCSRAGNCTTPQNVSCRGSRSLREQKKSNLGRAGVFFFSTGKWKHNAKEPNGKELIKFYWYTVLKQWGNWWWEVVGRIEGRGREGWDRTNTHFAIEGGSRRKSKVHTHAIQVSSKILRRSSPEPEHDFEQGWAAKESCDWSVTSIWKSNLPSIG